MLVHSPWSIVHSKYYCTGHCYAGHERKLYTLGFDYGLSTMDYGRSSMWDPLQ